jgi:ribosome-associated protein
MSKTLMPNDVDLARKAVEVAAEQQASDVLLLDIRQLAAFADYFIILTAESVRQTNAVAEEITNVLKTMGAKLHHTEGKPSSGWMLLDYGDIVIHIFSPEQREYFRLEDLWTVAPPLIQIQ